LPARSAAVVSFKANVNPMASWTLLWPWHIHTSPKVSSARRVGARSHSSAAQPTHAAVAV